MMGMPPPEPDPGDTYKWANPERTQLRWYRTDLAQDLWVPVTHEGEPANSDWLLLKGWIDAGKIQVAEPDPGPPQPSGTPA